MKSFTPFFVAFLIGMSLVVLAAPSAQPQGYGPEMAAEKMWAADGFAVKLVAAEPLVRQPVAIDFDERGRLWVIQYLQYPNPAGLKRVQVDRYSRTVYDRVPEPPPKGPKGADRITILEGPDPTGRYRKSKDFLSDLNLASGMAFGHGGVFVLQAPTCSSTPTATATMCPTATPTCCSRGSAWRTPTPSPTR